MAKAEQQVSRYDNITKSICKNLDIIFPTILLSIPFIPFSKTIDEMAPQWLLISIAEFLICSILLYSGPYNIKERFFRLNTPIVHLFTAFTVYCILSILFSKNRTESLITAGRLVITFIGVIIMIVVHEKDTFKKISLIISLSLLFEVVYHISYFLYFSNTINYDALILSIKGNTGIKNVLAASILWKTPFLLYLIDNKKRVIHLISYLISTLTFTLLFILNTRSSFIGFIVMSFAFIVMMIFKCRKSKFTYIYLIKGLAGYFISILFAFALSTFLILKIKKYPINEDNPGSYGTLIERIQKINIHEGNNRIILWKDAINYIKQHPFIGCGIGNWKVESLQFTKYRDNDYYVPYHAHNDYLEFMTELGIPGGLLYLILLSLATIIAFRNFYSNFSNFIDRIPAMIFTMAILCYIVDAFFNFPSERPPMQICFMISLAGIVSLARDSKRWTENQVANQKCNKFPQFFNRVIPGFLLILLPVIYTGYKIHQSYLLQSKIYTTSTGNNQTEIISDHLFNSSLSIPNLNYYTIPMNAAKAYILIEKDKLEKAEALLLQSMDVNPYLGANELYLSLIHQRNNHWDSALYYAKISFDKRPRSQLAYFNYMTCLSKLKDTDAMELIFRKYIKFRYEYPGWRFYIDKLGTIDSIPTNKIIEMIDSVVLKHPGIGYSLLPLKSELKPIDQKTSDLRQQNNIDLDEISILMNKASLAFNSKNYKEAIRKFLILRQKQPNDYAYDENIGLCYFAMNDYKKALDYFNASLEKKRSNTGKSAFFAGMCHFKLGDRKKGCEFMNRARSNNYNVEEINAQSNYYCR